MLLVQRQLQRPAASLLAARFSSAAGTAPGPYAFETLKVTTVAPFVVNVELNRPTKSNAMNRAFWKEIKTCFDALSGDSNCRAVVLTGAGKNFTAGLDLGDHTELLSPKPGQDPSRRGLELRKLIAAYQASFTSLEQCFKPVIAAVHGACYGGGVDMISAADIRYCSADAFFCIKEVDLGLAADVGTLQRMPKVLGNDSLMRELAYTARNMEATEALSVGFVSRVFIDREALLKGAVATAQSIAGKSPIAVVGTKHNLNFSRDHTVAASLHYQVAWNQNMLQTADIPAAAEAMLQRKTPTFGAADE